MRKVDKLINPLHSAMTLLQSEGVKDRLYYGCVYKDDFINPH